MKRTTTVRDATPSDVDAIARLNAAAWEAAYAGIVPDAFLAARRANGEDIDRWWRGLSSAGRVNRVAVVDGVIAGYASFAPCAPADGDPGRCAELLALYVHPSRWRRGIGRRLFEDVAARVLETGREALVLWVLERNGAARCFYASVGGTLDDARRAFPKLDGPGLDEVRYRCVLTRPAPAAGAPR